jgi:hypothetical protein
MYVASTHASWQGHTARLAVVVSCHPQAEIANAASALRDHLRRLPSLRGRDRGLGHRDAAIMSRRVRELREQLTAEVRGGIRSGGGSHVGRCTGAVWVLANQQSSACCLAQNSYS